MDKIGHAAGELREMDELAAGTSPIHHLHPLAKLLVTAAYILLTVSYEKYDFSGLAMMILYPMFLFSASGVPVRTCFYKLRVVLPLVCAVGLLNPFFDRTVMLRIGGAAITGGVISMVTLMMKGVLCLMASFLLAATTSIDALCGALRKLHIPSMLVTLILLTYRYISVMMEEVSVMTSAYHLRAPGQKGIHISAWGSFLGQLLLRSMDRAEELYSSMRLRGFYGEFPYAAIPAAKAKDCLFAVLVTALLVVFRVYPIAQILGGLVI